MDSPAEGGQCKNSGWLNRSYYTTRAAALRCTREYCGDIDLAAVTALNALPERHTNIEESSSAPLSVPVALERTD